MVVEPVTCPTCGNTTTLSNTARLLKVNNDINAAIENALATALFWSITIVATYPQLSNRFVK